MNHLSPEAESAFQKWSIVALLSLGMVVAYIDRANLSVVLTSREFCDLFQIRDAYRGLLNSAFFWSYAFLQIPAGWLVDRYGTKRPYALGFLFWSAVSAFTGLVHNVSQLLTMRLLLGVGESVAAPASLRWIKRNCREEERGLAVGIYLAGTKIGAAVGIPITAFLIFSFNWRLMFVLSGAIGLFWLIGWLALAKDDDRGTADPPALTNSEDEMSFQKVILSPAMWGILLGTFAYSYFFFFCLTWLPAYFVEYRHLSVNAMSFYTIYGFGGLAVVAILAGEMADRLIKRGHDAVKVRKTFTIFGLVAASTEVLGAYTESQSIALSVAVFSLAGLGLATANYWALTQTLIPGRAIGRVAGIQNCASNASGIAASLLTGWLKQTTGSYHTPLQAIWVVLLIGIFSYTFLVKAAPCS
jgi:MFS transporter, ACS family, D-galactonate transporter